MEEKQRLENAKVLSAIRKQKDSSRTFATPQEALEALRAVMKAHVKPKSTWMEVTQRKSPSPGPQPFFACH